MWRKTMTYLGLGPDEEYEDEQYYDDPVEPAQPSPRPPAAPPEPVSRPAPAQPRATAPARPAPGLDDGGDVRVVSAVRTIPPEPAPAAPEEPVESPSGAVVRAMPSPARARPHVVSPTSFDDAKDIGNAFKQGLPVIMNLGGADRDLARRLIDFASGVCFGLEGSMERVAPQVYLLTPTDVEVSEDDRRRLQARGLHR